MDPLIYNSTLLRQGIKGLLAQRPGRSKPQPPVNQLDRQGLNSARLPPGSTRIPNFAKPSNLGPKLFEYSLVAAFEQRSQYNPYMGVPINKGPQNRPQYTISSLLSGTPKQDPQFLDDPC